MEDEKKQDITEAQLQIERLMKMKVEKDKKDKMRGDGPVVQAVEKTSYRRDETVQETPRTEVRASGPVPRAKKQPRSVRIEKRQYEKLHRIVQNINAGGGPKISKGRFINLVMKEFLALDIDYSVVKSREEIKKLFERIKTGN